MKPTSTRPVALITGAAKRIGATIARHLHQHECNIALHYRHSMQEAQQLADELNNQRPHSVITVYADLSDLQQLKTLIQQTIQSWGRLDALINNASSFFPTPLATATEAEWSDLINSNLKGPFFLTQAAAPYLKKTKGCVINITDTHGQKPLKNYSIYCIAKAGLIMLTRSLAKELGPEVRVNGVSPGPILWPTQKENLSTEAQKQQIIEQTVLKRQGTPLDIAKAVRFLLQDANYVTGQILAVDGGRLLNDAL